MSDAGATGSSDPKAAEATTLQGYLHKKVQEYGFTYAAVFPKGFTDGEPKAWAGDESTRLTPQQDELDRIKSELEGPKGVNDMLSFAGEEYKVGPKDKAAMVLYDNTLNQEMSICVHMLPEGWLVVQRNLYTFPNKLKEMLRITMNMTGEMSKFPPK